MPTPEQLRANDELRGRFLSALWDADESGNFQLGICEVSDLLESINASELPDGQIARLLRNLEQDGLIEGMGGSIDNLYNPSVQLTSSGREEVSRWIRTDRPTEHLPIRHTAIYNNMTTIHNPQGSAINIGSQGQQSTLKNRFGGQLTDVVSKVRELLAVENVGADDLEDVEDSLATLQEQSKTNEPNTGRVRVALKRLGRWALGTGQVAATAALSAEVQQVIDQALQLVG